MAKGAHTGNPLGKFTGMSLTDILNSLPQQTAAAQSPGGSIPIAEIMNSVAQSQQPPIRSVPSPVMSGTSQPAASGIVPMPNDNEFNTPANMTKLSQAVSPAPTPLSSLFGNGKFLGMDKNKLQMVTGLAANAIAPNSQGGRLGKAFGGIALANIAADRASQFRQTARKERIADEQARYDRGAQKREQDMKNAQLTEKMRLKALNKKSDYELYQEDPKAYTQYKNAGSVANAPVGYAEFEADPAKYAQFKKSGQRSKELSPQQKSFSELSPAMQKAYWTRTGRSADTGKPMTISEKKFAKQEAKEHVTASMGRMGADFDPDDMTVTVPTDKTGAVDPEILTALDESGFQFTTAKDVNKSDKPYWFTGDNYSRTIYLSDFSAGKKAGSTPNKKDRKPLSSFKK